MFELLGTITVLLIPLFLLLDFVFRRHHYKTTKHWRLRGALVTLFVFFFAGYVAAFWGELFGSYSLLDLGSLGIAGGAVVGIVVYEFIHYWYHRAAHKWNWLWRAGHQMHHSTEGLDTFGAYYLHPIDAFMFTTISSLVFFPLLGVVTEAGVIAALFLTFNAMFQHANIRTPRWLGYIIQRPESHSVHHGRGVHRYNYADLPIFDIVFGTFRNPKQHEVPQENGFYHGASDRIIDMLVFEDVSKPEKETKPVAALTMARANQQ